MSMESKYDKYFTPEVLERVRGWAERSSKNTGEQIETDEFVSEAVAALIAQYSHRFDDPTFPFITMFRHMMKGAYTRWSTTVAPGNPCERERNYARIPISHFVEETVDTRSNPNTKQLHHPENLRTYQDTHHMILEHDVEHAISQLPPLERELVRAYLHADAEHPFEPEELSLTVAARRLGWTRDKARYYWRKAHPKLKVLLAEYKLRDGKRQTETSQAAPLRTA